jgi:hypothetical protein
MRHEAFGVYPRSLRRCFQQSTLHHDVLPALQALASLNARGYDVLQDLTTFGILVAKLGQGSAAAAAAAAGGGAVTAAAQAAALQSAAGIETATVDAPVKLIRPVVADGTDAPGLLSPSLQPSAAAAAAGTAQQCKWPDAVNSDSVVGLKEEGRSYGMKQIQADAPEIQEIADKFKSKVLYCVMDTGLDTSNQEFEGVGGCCSHSNSGITRTLLTNCHSRTCLLCRSNMFQHYKIAHLLAAQCNLFHISICHQNSRHCLMGCQLVPVHLLHS